MRMFAEKNIVTGTIDVVAFEQIGKEKHYLKSIQGDQFNWEPVSQGESAECFLKLSFEFAADFINHLVEAMGEAGVRIEPHSFYEGKLEGMEEHIETLKKLLGLDHDDKVVNVTITRKDAVDGDTEKSDDGRKTEEA